MSIIEKSDNKTTTGPTQIGPSGLAGWIGWMFFSDLAKGLSLTLGYMFSRSITEQYPDKQTWRPYPRYRGHHFLKTNEDGDVNCVGCELCAKICPCDCIKVVPFEDEAGNRRPLEFEVDMARCLFCGLCEDACPADAIALGQHYEFSTTNTADLVVAKEALIAAPHKALEGGSVVSARLDRSIGRPVIDTNNMKETDWWRRIRRR